ncbi:MAG: transposase [Acidobacteriota bacterium]
MRRIEIEGGLYHVIVRGNDRQDIFHTPEHHGKFVSLVARAKERSPFFLYAWCLMTNHLHLLIERRDATVGAIMQRVLTGYSQWYNRRHRHIGHVFQGRHKSILCQSDVYLAELVRYIHLNPVRAAMVDRPEDYPHSSHRAYLGLEPEGIADVDPVLRHFGAVRERARANFQDFVMAGVGMHHPEDLDSPLESGVLGSEEFVDAAIHRIGWTAADSRSRARLEAGPPFDADALISAVEEVFGLSRDRLPGKNLQAIMAKEVLVLVGREAGASIAELADLAGIDDSSVSRRIDAARETAAHDAKLVYAKQLVETRYRAKIAETHA